MAIPRLQLRADLIASRITLRDRCVWVLKDPLSRAFHFFDEAEYAILRSLRESSSFAILAKRYRDCLEPEILAQFLSAAMRAGLLITPDEVSRSPAWRPAPPPARPSWGKNPLAIRLPGVAPDRLMKWLVPATSVNHVFENGTLSARARSGAIAAILLLVIAGLILGLRSEVFVADFADASTRLLSPLGTGAGAGTGTVSLSRSLSSTFLAFAMAVAITKIVHELAHAWVCHALGGRCREIGVLLLLGIPCLYCDVSDTWLMPRRRDRMLVSAAGVIAEWMIAAIAVIVWAATQPGLLHDVAALIVVVASVSTLLVNGNPLLRYDGYYILSDWTGVPNLSSEAATAMRRFVARCFWFSGSAGEHSAAKAPPSQTHSQPANPHLWLVAYAIASGLYRTLVFSVIGWMVFGLLSNTIGLGVALPITAWLAFVLLNPRLKKWLGAQTHAATARQDYSRTIVASILLGSAIVLSIMIPLPRSIRVGGLVRPLHEHPIYVRETGRIVASTWSSSATPSSTVLQLDDWRLRLQEQVSRGRMAELAAELKASRINRLDRPALSALQPILSDEIASEMEKHATLLRRLSAQSLSWGSDQQLFAPPSRLVTDMQRAAGRWGWIGTPLASNNLGATLQSGTMLGRVGDSRERVVSLYVAERSIGAVRVAQSVTLGLPSLPRHSIRGHVQSVSADPVDDLPAEIVAAGWTLGASNEHRTNTAREVFYEVNVVLDTTNEFELLLPARMVTAARIQLPASSLFSQWGKWWRANM